MCAMVRLWIFVVLVNCVMSDADNDTDIPVVLNRSGGPIGPSRYYKSFAGKTYYFGTVFRCCNSDMVYLTEMHNITILHMIGYGDRTRTQAEVVRLFQEKYPELPPIPQGTVSKIEKQFRECGHVRQLNKNSPKKLSDDQKLDSSYFRAMQFCRQQGMELVSIPTQAVNDWIARTAEELGLRGNFWTSGTNLGDLNQWVWLSTGENVVYTNWYPTEPSNLVKDNVTENCIEIRHFGEFRWNDLSCRWDAYFICESVDDC
ncbi:hypothetical protein NQ318_012967 [Aromia moschata]|uniref:C-type lectin domain-containing protein n=1 Tax=Aromia moschata TaxID=1265417 RepID=A0AAV8XNB8_9CUCU|nr:hypothetical protein NQ318_012967 [Aromia moschata]